MKKTKRITPVAFGDISIEIDADNDWQEFLDMPARERLASINTELHFLIHLGWMDLPYGIKARFWKSFNTESAGKARSVAIEGLTATNHQDEWNLAMDAMQFHRDRAAGKFKDSPESATSEAIAIAVAFSDMVAKLDPAAFRRLTAIIETRGLPQGDRGGIGSEDGFMLEKFCELHASTYSLPTKKQLREACRLNEESKKKIADKRMKKLGLWGLPAEPEL